MTELLPVRTTRSHPFRPAARLAAGVAAGVVLVVGSAPTAVASTHLSAVVSGTPGATPSAAGVPSVAGRGDDGLFGVQDPTYDGVFRQAIAIGGLEAAHVAVPDAAIGWLVRQQCADGSFTSYRPATTRQCSPSGWDSNATAAAVQALVAVGSPTATGAATRAVSWLRTVQDADGGFAFAAGGATDANSTGLALAALAAVGADPSTVDSAGGKNPLDAIGALQVGCPGGAIDVGGLAFQPQKDGRLFADTFATSGALLGFAGGAFPVIPRTLTNEIPAPTCPAHQGSVAPTSAPAATSPATPRVARVPTVSRSPGTAAVAATSSPAGAETTTRPVGGAALTSDPTQAARFAGGYLARNMHVGNGFVVYAGVPDVGQTLNAVLGLTRLGIASAEVADALAALRTALPDWVVDDKGVDRPGSLGEAAMAVTAAGADPAAFGGVDYGRRILATLRTAAATSSPSSSPSSSPRPTASATPRPTRSTTPPSSPVPTVSATGSPTVSASSSAAPTTTAPTTTAPTTTGPGGTGPGGTATPTATPPAGVAPTVPPAPPGGTLPRTGSSATLPLAVGGLLLLGLGVALRVDARRRPR